MRGGQSYALKSRAVAVLGIGEEIQEARQISIEGVNAIKGGALWYRTDIGSEEHINESKKHMERLRLRR